MASPSRMHEGYDGAYKRAADLYERGVKFAISGGAGSLYTDRLPYEAGVAVAFGLPEEEAIKAVTINAAELMGLEDRIGSLEPGKQADLIVCDVEDYRDILEIYSRLREGEYLAIRPIGHYSEGPFETDGWRRNAETGRLEPIQPLLSRLRLHGSRRRGDIFDDQAIGQVGRARTGLCVQQREKRRKQAARQPVRVCPGHCHCADPGRLRRSISTAWISERPCRRRCASSKPRRCCPGCTQYR